MTLREWCRLRSTARGRILLSLHTLHRKVDTLMATLNDVKANEEKLHALVDKLLALVQAAQPGTFTPEQQAELDAIAADQAAVLAEDPSPSA